MEIQKDMVDISITMENIMKESIKMEISMAGEKWPQLIKLYMKECGKMILEIEARNIDKITIEYLYFKFFNLFIYYIFV